MSQRFCLRWNNHQSNMLSVFDQLLHDESFVDVTLAVDGHLFKAHKMVLSACSPLFQALFIGHPDKHPIVILKDVPYADMRCLLDFMYRGEVSVDQDRLTAFLKVAESLRIKGLTEVNEEKCDIPSITNNLLSSLPNAQSPPPPPPPPPPHLHRIPPHGNGQGGKRTVPPLVASNPLLGSALTAPKRKRGRPRKLSGSSNGDPSHTRDSSPHDDPLDLEFDARLGHGSSAESPSAESLHSSPPPPEMMEMHMDYGQLAMATPTPIPTSTPTPIKAAGSVSRFHEHTSTPLKEAGAASKLATPHQQPRKKAKEDHHEPTPGTSSQDSGQLYRLSSNNINSASNLSSGNGSLHNSSGGPGSGGSLNTDSFSSGLGDSQLSSSAVTPSAASTPASTPTKQIAFKAAQTEELEDEKYADMITNSPLPLDEDERRKTAAAAAAAAAAVGVVSVLPKRDIFDKRKLTRPRKLTDLLALNHDDPSLAAAEAAAETAEDRDGSRDGAMGLSRTETDEYEALESLVDRPEAASTPGSGSGSEMEQNANANASRMVQAVRRSVRENCIREPGNLFRCKLCSRTYTHISNFCRHYITTHQGLKQEIPCEICGRCFTRKDNMVTHKKMVHGCSRNDRPPVAAPNPQQ